MSRFSRLVWGAACGLCLTGTVDAQAPPIARPTPAVHAPAEAFLEQTIAAQKSLNAVSATLVIQSTSGEGDSRQTMNLAFRKGAGAKVGISDKTGLLAQIISDGSALILYDVANHRYVRRFLPAELTPRAAVFGSGQAFLPVMMARPEGLRQSFSTPGLQARLSAGFLGRAPVDILTFHPPVEEGQARVTLTLVIGHDDHLLRKFAEIDVLTQGETVHTFTHTETVTGLNLSPTLTAADFRFSPPRGVKKVASLEPPLHDPRLKPGTRPFTFTARDLQGRPLTLSQYRGKVVLMDFWATWCGPCVGEMPSVIAAYNKYHLRGFDVIGISLDGDKSALKSFLAQNSMPWRQVYDGKRFAGAVPKKFGVTAIPFGLLLNRNGTIAAVDVRGEALPAAINAALAKR